MNAGNETFALGRRCLACLGLGFHSTTCRFNPENFVDGLAILPSGTVPTVLSNELAAGYDFRNATRPNTDTGRLVEVYTDANGSMIVVTFVDGDYAGHAEFDASEVAMIADYA